MVWGPSYVIICNASLATNVRFYRQGYSSFKNMCTRRRRDHKVWAATILIKEFFKASRYYESKFLGKFWRTTSSHQDVKYSMALPQGLKVKTQPFWIPEICSCSGIVGTDCRQAQWQICALAFHWKVWLARTVTPTHVTRPCHEDLQPCFNQVNFVF